MNADTRRAAGAKPLALSAKARDLLGALESDGWRVVRIRGSHRQLRHPTKRGTVTVAGKPGADVPRGTLSAILEQAGLRS